VRDAQVEADSVSSPMGNQPSLGGHEGSESLDDFNAASQDELLDQDDFGEDEDDIRGRQKLNSVSTISNLRMKPTSSSRFSIPLCRMVPMPMVRPTLESDLAKLEQEFVHGYREGAAVFYVSMTNEDGKSQEVTSADVDAWGPLWNAKNDTFNAYLESVPELRPFTNLMFFVCDGNHRRQAWMNHIERLHKNEATWHYAVDSIVLETKDRIGVVMQVMHDINK